MIGADALKPLNTSHRPSVSSHRKIGTSAIADQAEYSLLIPTTCPSAEEIMRGGADEAQQRDDARYEPGPIHQRSEEQGVDAGKEGLPDQERPVVNRDE